jgi:hypothetical protein
VPKFLLYAIIRYSNLCQSPQLCIHIQIHMCGYNIWDVVRVVYGAIYNQYKEQYTCSVWTNIGNMHGYIWVVCEAICKAIYLCYMW